MDQGKTYPNWFLWVWEKGPFLFFGGGFVMISVVVGVGLYLNQRFDQIENRLHFVAPQSYQAPVLDDYDAGDVVIEELPVRKKVYVPVYSHVYYQGGSPFPLETTLSIRNTDPGHAVYLKSVEYFETSGKLVKTHLDRTIRLAPLQTIEFLVERRDSSGGSGANFIVEWRSDRQVNQPLVEAVMVGTVGAQAICFARPGINISESSAGEGEQ